MAVTDELAQARERAEALAVEMMLADKQLPVGPVLSKMQTIEELPDAIAGDGQAGLSWWWYTRGPILPAWGTRERERKLLRYYRHDRNTLVRSVFANVAKKIESTPWQVSGPDESTQSANTMLGRAWYGDGFGALVQATVIDFLRHDIGAFWYLVGPAKQPEREMTPSDMWRLGYGAAGPLYGMPTDIVILDAMRCYPTGDPTFPVLYNAKSGARHLLHWTRVVHFVDGREKDDNFPDTGTCALSRAISAASREMFMDAYVEQSVDDKPKPGIMAVSNMNERKVREMFAQYKEEQGMDELPPYGRTAWAYGLKPTELPVFNPVPFAEPPTNWDWVSYVELDAKVIATAIGVDPQDVLPLTTGNLGTGTQTEILAAQARGKTEGALRAQIERALNWKVLPLGCEFQFHYNDARQDEEQARIATQRAQTLQTVASAAQVAGVPLPERVFTEYLVTVDENFERILTDESGALRRLTDLDPKPDDEVVAGDTTGGTGMVAPSDQPETATPQIQMPVTPTAEAQPATSEEEPAPPSADSPENIAASEGLNGAQIAAALQILEGVVDKVTAPTVGFELLVALGISPDRARRMVDDTVANIGNQPVVEPVKSIQLKLYKPRLYGERLKAWADTRREFVDTLAKMFQTFPSGGVRDFAQLRRRFRRLLKTLGRQAFIDGLEEGGVPADQMTTDDKERLAAWQADQETYLDRATNDIYPNQLSKEKAQLRADLWANKSLSEVYYLGKVSGDKNAMLTWVLGQTEKHCRTCLAANGQIHRRLAYMKSGIYPRSDKLECRGFHCDCALIPTPGEKARGRLPTAA